MKNIILHSIQISILNKILNPVSEKFYLLAGLTASPSCRLSISKITTLVRMKTSPIIHVGPPNTSNDIKPDMHSESCVQPMNN